MSLAWIGALGLVALAPTAPADSPVAWSPGGKWVAYTVSTRRVSFALPERWLFRPDALAGEAGGNQPADDQEPAVAYRLWTTRVDSWDSVLLQESRGPLSAPSWSPDGKALAFARIVPEGPDEARYEVVLQDEPDQQRVLFTRKLEGSSAHSDRLSGCVPAWSPDGRFLALAIPQQTLDLAILRADNGRLLKIFPEAERPAWSPDVKNPTLAFVRGRDRQVLHWVDGAFGAPRILIELGRTTQAPFWLDANSVAAVASVGGRKGLAVTSEQLHLIRVAVETNVAQPVATLSAAPTNSRSAPRNASFSFDTERENLFYTRDTGSAPYEIVWSRPRHNEVLKPFHPYDFTIPSSALALGPQDRLLAFRTGRGGSEALPAVVDLTDERLSPTALVPDDDVRVQWIVTLAATARRLLFVALPAAKLKEGTEVERASILPLPGEIAPHQELLARLRGLGRLGRAICDRPADASPAEPDVERLLAEARLFFDYLRQDYDAALASLDALETHQADPDGRLRLLSVRAQLYVAQGRAEQARETIGYLRARERVRTEQIEETPLGPALRTIADPNRNWSQYLLERSEAYMKAVRKPTADEENAHNPFGNRNPDAPDDGVFGIPVVPRRPRPMPFGQPRPGVRQDGMPDVVMPPGGVIIAPEPPAPRLER